MLPNVNLCFLDAGIFIGGLRRSDPRFAEAFPLLDSAQRGVFNASTSVGVLSEVYAALTWTGAQPPLTPAQARMAITQLIEPPSAIIVLSDGLPAGLLHLQMAETHQLTARRIHDARHAATALQNGVSSVYTYDPEDWSDFVSEGITIVGPPSTISRLTVVPSPATT